MNVENCVFCKIVKGEIKSQKVYEDEETLAFLDINPVNKGHVLVIPKDHYENIFDIPKEKLAKVMEVVQKVAIALKKMGADGVNIVSNNGKAADQHVFHLHVHVIPRYYNDGKEMDSINKRTKYKDENEMMEYANKIRLFLV